MAKQSQIHRDLKRKKLIKKYAEKRKVLRDKLNDPNASYDEKIEAQEQFAKLPRNSCPTRLNNRCAVSGRSKAYYRKFGISRIAPGFLQNFQLVPNIYKFALVINSL